jgi:hypothetical protein
LKKKEKRGRGGEFEGGQKWTAGDRIYFGECGIIMSASGHPEKP